MQPSCTTPKNKSSVLAIIPARGGSKGIPKKNIRLLAGKPLIEYTIDAAKKSRFLNRIVVSTDDIEIGTLSKKNGVDVIIRPDSIARDESSVIETIEHVMSYLQNNEEFAPDIIVLLQPTSPLRNTEDIDGAIQQFLTGKFDSLISVCETGHSPYWCFTISDTKLKPLFNKKMSYTRRQDLPHTYRPNGAIYVTTPGSLKKFSGFMTNKTSPYIMPIDRSIDIDNPMDFFLAEFLIEKGKNFVG
jgi:N-acylneuraminate cytidylyltransferase